MDTINEQDTNELQLEKDGVEAIIFLQSIVGITETQEYALRSWRRMADWEKQATMTTYEIFHDTE